MVTDAVVLVVQGEEEEASNEKHNTTTSNDPSITSSFGSKSHPEALSPPHKHPLTGSKSQVQISTFSGHQPSPEITTNLSSALDDKQLMTGSNSPPYMASPNNKVSANTPKENLEKAPITPKKPLMSSPGPAGGEEDEEDEDIHADPFTPKTPLMASPGREDEEDEDIYKINKAPRLMERRHLEVASLEMVCASIGNCLWPTVYSLVYQWPSFLD
ncbi:hypothetical protein BVC80_1837g358 [Macleaya cordata]|uniref:Uncharacterized protein n=1 Tax=Macleaya cordata TaxID=56857 RepID=A0A200R493_MACCD|nr:hypothetical protein BVC80_1837g358 [Macleaya cordata]